MPPDADCDEHDDYVRPRPITEEAYQLVKEEAVSDFSTELQVDSLAAMGASRLSGLQWPVCRHV